MAKRKSGRTPRKIKAAKLETRFDCPICSHENVVQCKITKLQKRGVAFCSVCEAHYGCEVNPLDKPIDIYHAWIDEISKDRE